MQLDSLHRRGEKSTGRSSRNELPGCLVWSFILCALLTTGTTALENTVGDLRVFGVIPYGLSFFVAVGMALFYFAGDALRGYSRGTLTTLLFDNALLLFTVPQAFSEICRELFVQFGGFSGVHSSGPGITGSNLDWAVFGWSWTLNAVTFNASQVFGWVTTPIQSSAWWSGTLVVFFSFVADTVFFASLVNVIRGLFNFDGGDMVNDA